MTVFWNRNSGFDGGIRGSLGWDGAIILHFRHCALVCRMLASNPGQNSCCRALAIIPLTPWCAECSASRTSARSCLSIRIFFFFYGHPIKTIQLVCHRPKLVGFSMVVHGVTWGIHSVCTPLTHGIPRQWPQQPRSCPRLGSCSYADIIDACIARSICWVMSILVTPLCFGDAGYLEVQSAAAFSFPGTCLMWNLYINERSLKVSRRGFSIFSRPDLKIFSPVVGDPL